MTDTVNIVGQRADGSSVLLGTAPMPPEMKRKEIARSMCGELSDDESGTAADYCLWSMEQYHDWLVKQGWKPPELKITPA